MLFDNGFNNRIDTKKACDYTHFVNTPRTISLLPPGLDVSRDSTRCFWTYRVKSLKGILSDRFLLLPNFAGSKRRELFRHAKMTLIINYILYSVAHLFNESNFR